ncbi:MAG: acetate--CoA ligase [Oligoflexus sp.]
MDDLHRIRKRSSELDKFSTPAWLENYEQTVKNFSWEDAAKQLDGLPGNQGINIAYEAVDRHGLGENAKKTAIRWVGRKGDVKDISYQDLSSLSSRFANALQALGVGKGDTVFVLLPRVPELYIAAIGTLKNTSVFCPLFSVFGPEPIKARMNIGKAKVLVTTKSLFTRKLVDMSSAIPTLQYIITVDDGDDSLEPAGTLDFATLLDQQSDAFHIPPTRPEDTALIHFTSGTTGTPKGAVHVHQAIVAHHVTAQFVLDLHPDDIYWCTADPGWVTGTSYGILAPLTNGVTMIVDEGDFDADRWYELIQKEGVNIWYTAPTAIRMMMKQGAGKALSYDLSSLRFIASVGEPLNPEAIRWGFEAFHRAIHDNWWQTETGGIMIANFRTMDIKLGSMGRPIPGVEAAIVHIDDAGQLHIVNETNVQGQLALKLGWPSMFRAYLGNEERYRQSFKDGYYLTGDLAKQDEDHYFWFIGRADDVIKSAGHLIGPFEVESALMEHPAVAEAGVIGKPDPVLFELVKAFISLKPGYRLSEDLQKDIMGYVRKRLGPAVAPREISVVDNLPKTRSGKIMRRLLKARELGLPEGDTSTLESI